WHRRSSWPAPGHVHHLSPGLGVMMISSADRSSENPTSSENYSPGSEAGRGEALSPSVPTAHTAHAGDPYLTGHHPSGVSQRRPSDLGPPSDGSMECCRDFTAPPATGRTPVSCGSSEAPPGPIRRGDQEQGT